jgi:DNA invertase Pin-like site-specific DNA recombinase
MAKKQKELVLVKGWAIYLRTSTDDVQNPEASQKRQLDNIQNALVNPSSIPVIEIYRDIESGRKVGRKNYQRMLSDARLGKFSHIAVEAIDRFGRDNAEIVVIFKELTSLGLEIRIANQPSMRLAKDARQDRLLAGILALIAQDESERIAERVSGGMRTKALAGGHIGLAPEGYINRENRAEGTEVLKMGRYQRWVEPEPEGWQMLRLAWDLLLTNRYTLAQICEELHAKGFCLSNDRPFVYYDKNGYKKYHTSVLSRIFHNAFYAGWVVSKHVEPKTIRGDWKPVVSPEEFEAGLSILASRFQKRNINKIHFYLLKGIIYIEHDGTQKRLICSKPNIYRPGGGTAYYMLRQPNINILCRVVDDQIPTMLAAVGIHPEHLEDLRTLYAQEILQILPLATDSLQHLKKKLQSIISKERDAFREYLDKRVSEETWTAVSAELSSIRQTIEREIVSSERQGNTILQDLDAALPILAHISELYAKLSLEDQQSFLRLLVERIVVNPEGIIIAVEFLPPFGFISECYIRAKKAQTKKLNANQKTTILLGGGFTKKGIFFSSTRFRTCTPDKN